MYWKTFSYSAKTLDEYLWCSVGGWLKTVLVQCPSREDFLSSFASNVRP